MKISWLFFQFQNLFLKPLFDIYLNKSIISDNITCQTKCKVTLEDIDSDHNKLREVDVIFSDNTYAYEPCTWPYYPHALSMNIICPTWNKGKYMQLNLYTYR